MFACFLNVIKTPYFLIKPLTKRFTVVVAWVRFIFITRTRARCDGRISGGSVTTGTSGIVRFTST